MFKPKIILDNWSRMCFNVFKMENRKIIKASKTNCSICKQPIFGNVNPEKILTCTNCIFALLAMEKDLKVYYRDKLVEVGRNEIARSVESFIPEEVDAEIATFKTSCLKKGSKRLLYRVKRRLHRRSRLNRRG